MAKQRRRTVVAVDDDDINLMILTKNAQDAGYTVKSFTSGETAWDYLENNQEEVDIAVLDKMMPGMRMAKKLDLNAQRMRIRLAPLLLFGRFSRLPRAAITPIHSTQMSSPGKIPAANNPAIDTPMRDP